jgi:hypothetical protein
MEDNLLNSALLEVAKAIKPIGEIDSATKATALLKKLGYELPGLQEFTSIPVSLIGKIAGIAEDIILLADAETDEDKLRAVMQLVSKVKDITIEIGEIAENMQAAGAAVANFFTNAPVSELPMRLLDYIISVYLETYYGSVYYLLLLIGFVDEIEKIANPAIFQPSFTLRKIQYERLPKYFNEPLNLSEEIYRWQTDFNSDLFLTRLEKMLRAFMLPGGLYNQSTQARLGLGNTNASTKEVRIPIFQGGDSPELYSQFGLVMSGAEASAGKLKGLALMPYATGVASLPFNLNENYDITLEISAGIDNGIGIILRPPLSLEFINNLLTAPGSVGEFAIKVSLKKKTDRDTETFIFGSATTSHLSIKGIEFDVFFSKKNTDIDFGIEFEIRQGKVVIGVEGADGFIEKILSGIHMEIDFGLGIGFTAKGGFYFRGSGGLEIQIPLHLELGPLKIENLLLRLQPNDGQFPLTAATTLGLNIGPLSAVVENIGVKLTLSFPDGGGNLGPANFELGFQPPNGVGLSINAGAVIGGGYLFFDFEKEEYAGVLELTIAGFISAKAIGLITTKMPDGSKGFSMLIIITAEFMPAFQLGYGFTLIGVGGLLGLNRTVLLDPLRDAVRTGAVTSIMFPQNVVANAPRIISDLKAIFPPYEGKFLIGPMAKLGWGTPTLISLSLGLIIEIPGNFAILGVLKIALPEERIPLVQIQVLFVGTIDFDKKMLTFDASLYESFILTMTIEGDMAVRLKWGDNPDFLLSVGGFHPSYTPPPLALPTMRRLAINILNTDIAKIRVECYQAITSNTVQFGARADIMFDLSACSITGFISFDALFQFSPFYFIIEVAAGFSLKAAGIDLLSVRVRMSLEGPTPWRARGTGSVSILFFEISADFDVTWGEEKNTALASVAILENFITEVKKKEMWSTILSTGKNLLVSLRKFNDVAEADVLVMHPAGSLVIQQKLLPLKIKFDKIGNQKTSDVQKIEITKASSSGDALTIKDVDENFARAQYQNLSDAEKLSKPSFEKMAGGVSLTLGANTIKNGKLVRKKVKYETTIIDKEPVKPKKGLFFGQLGILFANFLKGNSVSKSVLSKNYTEKLQPFNEKMNVLEEGYTVAFQANNTSYTTGSTFSSEMMAQTFMQNQIAKNPSLKKEVHIILTSELQTS